MRFPYLRKSEALKVNSLRSPRASMVATMFCVLNLLASYRNLAAQRHQRIGYVWSVFENLEGIIQHVHVSQRVFAADGDSPSLWTSDNSQVLPQNLTAASHGILVRNGALQPGSGDIVFRRFQNAGFYQDVCVDKNKACYILSLYMSFRRRLRLSGQVPTERTGQDSSRLNLRATFGGFFLSNRVYASMSTFAFSQPATVQARAWLWPLPPLWLDHQGR